jgi:hypothetical protein
MMSRWVRALVLLLTLEGRVRAVDEHTLTLTVPGGEMTVDLSAMRLPVRLLLWPGRAVSVVAQRQPDGSLTARAVRVAYGVPETR